MKLISTADHCRIPAQPPDRSWFCSVFPQVGFSDGACPLGPGEKLAASPFPLDSSGSSLTAWPKGEGAMANALAELGS
ncbi:MAG: hypothetical protein ABR96_09375 [cyanobacterium BACL30 MAG-120619-bin27]|nr:MAG: hypothetical protein ABR96_09375 [cyanobacterium BACL30 MAG-120619-bin27]